MPLKFDVKYERSKKKISKKIALTLIEETEELYKTDPSHTKLNLKNIRVLGNDGYRILLTHKYDRLTKDC